MKNNIIGTFILMLILLSCDDNENQRSIVDGQNVWEIVHDECQYISFTASESGFTHKGNCKNPIHKF